jgi:hypothetical protein
VSKALITHGLAWPKGPELHEEAKVVWVDGCRPIYELTCFVVLIECLPEEVDVVSQGLVKALSEHEIVQKGERAREGHTVRPFTHDVPGCSGAVRTCGRNALQGLVSALVGAGCMNQEGVCVVLRLLMQSST